MSTVILWAVSPATLFVVLARARWRSTVIRKSMGLSDEMVRLLTKREVIWLQRGLEGYLQTIEGVTLAEDPRVRGRLMLFQGLLQGFDSRLDHTRLARALRATGLPKLPANDGENAA